MQKNAAMQIFNRQKSCYILSELFVKVFFLEIKCCNFIWYLPAKQSMPCDLAMTATMMTTMMMMATMTMAITGPLPASENRTVSLTAISCWELFSASSSLYKAFISKIGICNPRMNYYRRRKLDG